MRQHYEESIESHCYKWVPPLIDSYLEICVEKIHQSKGVAYKRDSRVSTIYQ